MFSVIDNFVLGMYAAQLLSCREECGKWYKDVIAILISVVGLYGVSVVGLKKGIHTDNISGYIWHSLVAICLALVLYYAAKIKCEHKHFFSKFLLWLSKYEYGIYIVPLLVIRFLFEHFSILQYWTEKMFIVTWSVLLICSILVGFMFSQFVNGLRRLYSKKL